MHGVVGCEVQIMVNVGLLSVNCGLHTAIVLVVKVFIKEWHVVVLFIFSCESYVTCGVDRVHMLS